MLPSPDSPFLFQIGDFGLRWYSLTMLAAVLSAQWLLFRRAKKYDIDLEKLSDMVMYALLFGFLGARLFHVLYEYQYYFQNIAEIPQIWHGGLAIHGGVICGALVIYSWCKKNKYEFLHIADLIIPGLLLGQIIGRWGNYFNQEAFGTPTSLPWGIFIKESHRPFEFASFTSFHPTFLYEGVWNALILLFLFLYEKKYQPSHGKLTGWYLISYGIGRGLLEFIRSDATYLGPLRFVHWISIGMIVVGIYLIRYRKYTVNQ